MLPESIHTKYLTAGHVNFGCNEENEDEQVCPPPLVRKETILGLEWVVFGEITQPQEPMHDDRRVEVAFSWCEKDPR